MGKNKTKTGDKVSEKKMNRLFILKRMDAAFSDLIALTGKKKYEKGIKKAAKLLCNNFSKKSFDSFRKLDESVSPQSQMREGTNLLIEELA